MLLSVPVEVIPGLAHEVAQPLLAQGCEGAGTIFGKTPGAEGKV